MLIGILETGRPPDALKDEHGSYPDMFRALIGPVDAKLEFRTYAALDGEVPEDPHACDAWLVTGSRHGVYERTDWMLKAEELLRRAVAEKVPVVGICFGHQLLAQALGGKVVKSGKGWGIGFHDYELSEAHPKSGLKPGRVTIPALHQDQVVEVPEGGRVIGSSEFCQNAIIAYGDTAITFQGHPEFDRSFLEGLIEVRLKGLAPDAVLDEARQTLADKQTDSAGIARWIAHFIIERVGQRADAADAQANRNTAAAE